MNPRVSMSLLGITAMAVLAACGGAPAAPTAAPAKPAESKPAAAAPASGAATAVKYTEPCTPAAATKPVPSGKNRLVIGTGGTGGVFYPYGGGLARILTSKLANTEATAEVTGGSVDNLKLLAKGDADLGLTTADSGYDAAMGESVYKDVGKVPACTLMNLYQSFIHVVTIDGTGVNDIADMKGKRISVGSAGSSTEVAADRLLTVAGLDPKKDITRDNLSVAESVNAIKDKKIDAFFWIGGLPTAAVTDLMATPGLKVKFIPTTKYVDALRTKYGPLYVGTTLSKDIYKGLEADVPGIGVGNILVVNANMNEQLAYNIIKTFFDNLEEVKTIHPEAKKLTLEAAATGSSLPYHPGAIRFFMEKGVWK